MLQNYYTHTSNPSFRFTNSMMYYALAFNLASLAGNIYINTALLGAVDFPAYFVGAALLAWKYWSLLG